MKERLFLKKSKQTVETEEPKYTLQQEDLGSKIRCTVELRLVKHFNAVGVTIGFDQAVADNATITEKLAVAEKLKDSLDHAFQEKYLPEMLLLLESLRDETR